MSTLPLSDIIINRPERQRRNLKSIDELAESISRIGLIHPPVITREYILVAGERRITAMLQLGWSSCPVTFTDELDPAQLQLIELEENTQRVDLPWQDEVAAVTAYHNLRDFLETTWSAAETAKALGRSPRRVQEYLELGREISTGNALIRDAQNMTVATNLLTRIKERRRASAFPAPEPSHAPTHPTPTQLEDPNGDPSPAPAPLPPPSTPILLADFNQWAPTYTGEPFNFIHCDFPYGINADKRKQGNSVHTHGGYPDSPDIYWALLETLSSNINRITSPSAHMMFWFSMDYYTETQRFLAKYLPEWVFSPFPLYWSKSDNVGLLPDPKRGPRRVVETALIGARGDRFIVQAVANHFAAPTERRSGHISVKPEAMLRHFFRMFVDENTSILDPTCGSASSLRAARALGATRLVGLEQNAEFADVARKLWRGEEITEEQSS